MKQIKNVDSVAALRELLNETGVEIPVADEVDTSAGLGQSVTIGGSGTPSLSSPNRFAILPMEGWDGTTDGGASDLTRRRWRRRYG